MRDVPNMRLTESDLVEMRRLYAKGNSYRQIAVMFKCHHETVRRVLKTCDAVSATAPSRKRARGATESDVVACVAPLVAGATNEAQRIMGNLQTLLANETERFEALQVEERAYRKKALNDEALRDMVAMQLYKGTHYTALGQGEKDKVEAMLPKFRFDALYKLYAQMSLSMLGVKQTLEQMGRLTKTLQINVGVQVNNLSDLSPEVRAKLKAEIAAELRNERGDVRERIEKYAELFGREK
jgi:transposase